MKHQIGQYPDVSLQMREKYKMSKKKYAGVFTIPQSTPDSGKALSNFQESVFRKWHFKLALIIAGSAVMVYVFILMFQPF